MTALYLRFHRWRGFPLMGTEPDLFHLRVPFGFATLFICKVCLIEARRKLRTAAETVVERHRG